MSLKILQILTIFTKHLATIILTILNQNPIPRMFSNTFDGRLFIFKICNFFRV
jgi:hypothetical protein